MNNIKISLAEVSATANMIRTLNQRMYEILLNIKKDMNELNASWISEAGETCRQKFNQFSARFDTEKETIDQYGKFLDYTVTSYDSLETTINANASSFQ